MSAMARNKIAKKAFEEQMDRTRKFVLSHDFEKKVQHKNKEQTEERQEPIVNSQDHNGDQIGSSSQRVDIEQELRQDSERLESTSNRSNISLTLNQDNNGSLHCNILYSTMNNANSRPNSTLPRPVTPLPGTSTLP